ncbi:MAG: class I SAM-dependent methyltransferase, partial [Pirellulaceae bacterium]|nr:class I SAM-dependent methyltransferase [Pirellulaceae bacterium]
MPILRTCLIICLAFAAAPVSAQDKSVRPGINKSFQNPNVARYVERFEREGREVYDHREKIIGECRIKPGMVVADIGAGTGLFTRLIAKQTGPSGKVLAVDISKKFVDHVTASCEQAGLRNVQGIVCTSESSALPPNSIDVAFICDVYHHFEFPYKSMRSIRNALKPGGRVVVVDFHRQEGVSSEFILKHVRADQETFVSEIHLAGFTTSRDLKF